MLQHRITRRQLLNGLGVTALLSFLGKANAFAQNTPPDYKALVCVFLSGGNDSHNMIVPLTQSEFNAYKAARGSLALPDSNGALVPVVTPENVPFGLNPGLTAIAPMWASGQLAVLANVGMLVQPVTRAQFLTSAVPVPTNLFSRGSSPADAEQPSTSGGTSWGARAADDPEPNGSSVSRRRCRSQRPALFCAGKIDPGLFPVSISTWTG